MIPDDTYDYDNITSVNFTFSWPTHSGLINDISLKLYIPIFCESDIVVELEHEDSWYTIVYGWGDCEEDFGESAENPLVIKLSGDLDGTDSDDYLSPFTNGIYYIYDDDLYDDVENYLYADGDWTVHIYDEAGGDIGHVEFVEFGFEVITHECGNGIIMYTEECDDGNTEPADGCSIRCK